MHLKLIKVIPKREIRELFLRETELFPPPLNSETILMTRKFFFKIRPQENKNKNKIKVWNFFYTICFLFLLAYLSNCEISFLLYITSSTSNSSQAKVYQIGKKFSLYELHSCSHTVPLHFFFFFFFGRENTSLSVLSLNPPKDPLMWLEKFYHYYFRRIKLDPKRIMEERPGTLC